MRTGENLKEAGISSMIQVETVFMVHGFDQTQSSYDV